VALIASSTVGLVDRLLEHIFPLVLEQFAFKHTHGVKTIFRQLSALYVAEFSLLSVRRMHNVCEDHVATFFVMRAFPDGN